LVSHLLHLLLGHWLRHLLRLLSFLVIHLLLLSLFFINESDELDQVNFAKYTLVYKPKVTLSLHRTDQTCENLTRYILCESLSSIDILFLDELLESAQCVVVL